jgi:radical SAM protein with 4Fe4S-binding SPASM domain
MCPNKDLPKDKKGFMDFDLYKKVIDEAKDFIYDISLLHRGESLLHPEFIKFLKYATRFDWKTKLHTNGVLLNEELAAGIIDAQLFRLSFSFDGYSADNYEKIRVGAKFDKVIENIKMILKLRKKMNSPFPQIILEFIDLPNSEISNAEKREKFLKPLQDLGLDNYVVKKVHNWAGYSNLDNPQHKPSPCTYLWHGLLVLWDGTLMPCSQDFFEHYPLENVKDYTLKEIWNGERIVNLRRKHITGEITDLKTCSDCDRINRKTIMGIPREYITEILKRRMP